MKRIRLFVLTIACAFGCMSAPEEEPPHPVSVLGAEAATAGSAADAPAVQPRLPEDPAESERFLQSRIDEIGNLLLKRDPERALDLLDDTFAYDPPEPFAHRLRSLEARTRSKLLDETWIDAFARFERERYTTGDVIQGEIVLMNVSTHRLHIPRSVAVAGEGDAPGEESRSVFRSVTTYREYVASGTLVVNADTRNFALEHDIVLESGQAHRIPIAIETMSVNPSTADLRTFTIDCKLHAPEIRVGERTLHGAIVFRPAVAPVLPRNAEHLAMDPMARVRQAFEKASPLHLVLAGSFVDGPGRDELVAWIRGRLVAPETSEPMARGLCSLMQYLSGNDEGRSREEWVKWIDARK